MNRSVRSSVRLSLRGCLLASAAIFLAGCSSEIPTAPVDGQVKLGGQPVGPGMVILEPRGTPTDAPRPSTTLKFAADGKISGVAPIGKHAVIIQSYEGEFGDEGPDVRRPPKIPVFYGDPAVNNMFVDIVEGENKLDFDLKPMR